MSRTRSFQSPRFREQKDGFRQVLSDPGWLPKVLIGGVLLINPLLVALAPAFFSGRGGWVAAVFPWIFAFNVLSFWFPLGFTYEVLRRARTGEGAQLPEWRWERLGVFAHEGAVKFTIALTTLLLPAALWMGLCYGFFIQVLGLPPALLTLFLPPILLLVIPFCGVACCRWLDGVSILDAALNYPENIRLFRKGWQDYLIAAAFIVGVNSITTAFFYTIPFGAIFGLCVVDTWFGPIYAETVASEERKSARQQGEQPVLAITAK
jgi:hypothetical protein